MTFARMPGPAGSLLIVEASHVVPLVQVIVAARTGSALDPQGQEGLTNLAGELARHGAAGRTREKLDEALDGLGASLDVLVDADSIRFVGQVLSRNLEPFLALLADVILRPDFTSAEFARTRREIVAQLDEMRNDDRTLCARFFDRRLFDDHPYGRPADGTASSLAAIKRFAAAERFSAAFVGRNLIFAAAGDVDARTFRAKVGRAFARLKPGSVARARLPAPRAPRGQRILLVDKPDRQQTQIMFGQIGVPATHPDFLALSFGLSTFGGQGMKSTLMDEVRTKRGLAYGAYMGLIPHRGSGPIRGWVFSAAERTITTLELVLRLYEQFADERLSAKRLAFFQRFLLGTHAADMDAPERRLGARVSAELEGLSPDWIDTFPARLTALTAAEVTRAIRAHVHPHDLAITLVASANKMTRRLTKAGFDADVVAFDSY